MRFPLKTITDNIRLSRIVGLPYVFMDLSSPEVTQVALWPWATLPQVSFLAFTLLLIDPVSRFYEAATEGSISLVRIFDPDAHTCLLLTSLTQLEEHCVWSGLSVRIYQGQGRVVSDVCVFIDWHMKLLRWPVPACFRTSAG